MVIEDYKETILHELEKANDCEEVEQIINCSIEQIPVEGLYRFLSIIYLGILQNGLEKISEPLVSFDKRFNIHHALYYLKQMNDYRSKVE